MFAVAYPGIICQYAFQEYNKCKSITVNFQLYCIAADVCTRTNRSDVDFPVLSESVYYEALQCNAILNNLPLHARPLKQIEEQVDCLKSKIIFLQILPNTNTSTYSALINDYSCY